MHMFTQSHIQAV